MKGKGKSLIEELSNLFFFWLIGTIFFSCFRIFFILKYSSDIVNTPSIFEFIKTLFMGFRFDITVISYFIAPPFISLLLSIPFKNYKVSGYIRRIFQVLFSVLSVFICVITINYYKEYSDQFNHFVFMGIHDDQIAVLKTIWDDFNPILNLIIILVLTYTLIKIFKYFENKKSIASFIKNLNIKYPKIIITLLSIFLFVGSIRGSYTEYPVRRFYANVSPDRFINKTILNPFRALNYAIKDYKEVNGDTDKNPFGEVSKDKLNNNTSITAFLEKETIRDTTKIIPNHIFLIVMESYDSWPLQEKYKDLNISNNLRELGEKGIHFDNFLPASFGTMNSLASIITGVPFLGVNMSKIGAVKSFPTSIFSQFEKLGYDTNFFYGGYSSWENIENFMIGQGVNNVFTAGQSKYSKGIWGINDEELFDEVYGRVSQSKKSLNIILTLSYHPPYEVDIYQKGYPYKSVDDLPSQYQKIIDENEMPIKVLGHLWYADLVLGEFVKKAETKYPNSIFAFTGDHYGRRYFNATPNLYERSSVPFILYGKNLKGSNFQRNKTPGSHIDITPTLLDLCSEESTKYYSFGTSLFNNTVSNKTAFGYWKSIDNMQLTKHQWNGGKNNFILDSTKVNKEDTRKGLIDLYSISWHYTMKGDTIQ